MATSINRPPRNPDVGKNYKLVLVCQPRHKSGLPYYLIRGNESFYDKEDFHIRFLEQMEAHEWAEKYLGILPSHHLPDSVREQSEAKFEEWKNSEERQEKLF